ncbi:MAG TPA: adenine-specific methyltransferase EcoRI family protein, partial [Candidatus Absconditabacterales bacterium]|nr:adenine-specific methyltransferase EcoRI family protein [Candidatus Absconditabacterales bacterium]HOQ79358.1 adenine-specific methyltransferase EcoRI family protein [Candidatus Absconditabacterales bacterium]
CFNFSAVFFMTEILQGGNANLHQAKKDKNDEFYTQLPDIENELRNYKHHFKDKVVFCNCDDPYESNFFKYFALNFNHLGLKKLIAMGYVTSPIAGSQVPLFEIEGYEHIENKAYKIEVNQVKDIDNNGAFDLEDIKVLIRQNKEFIKITPLKGNDEWLAGDFRSNASIKALKEADIVVTNPPFSLFREYVAQLMNYQKHFLIIGNKNAITYKEIFPLIKENKLWLGYSAANEFALPDGTITKKMNGLTRWYTNLDISKRHEELILYKKYNSSEYPKYDNYDAIEVGKVAEIPCDYSGAMGVPITFLDKYNPEQFEIIGLGIANLGLEIGVQPYKAHHREYRKNVQKRGVVNGDLYMVDKNNNPIVPYARILIKKIKHN